MLFLLLPFRDPFSSKVGSNYRAFGGPEARIGSSQVWDGPPSPTFSIIFIFYFFLVHDFGPFQK